LDLEIPILVIPAKAGIHVSHVGWTAPDGISCARLQDVTAAKGSRPMTIIRIGLDTSKHVFQVHGVDECERAVLRRRLQRSQVAKFFTRLAPTRIGLEACGASHHWARTLRSLGHAAVLIPPQYIKPYVKRGKNDAIDAAAICEAMSRPGMRFVPVKSADEQAALMLLKVRDLLVKQRTMLINAIRGHAAEFGVSGAKGPQKIADLLERIAEDAGVPGPARELLNNLGSQLAALEVRLHGLDAKLMAHHKTDPRSQLLATIPGVGPISAVSFALKVPDATVFRSGRHFAAWLGITPREHSTGGRRRLGKISREGDEGLRRLLVLGATAVIQQVERRLKAHRPCRSDSPWLLQLLARKPKKLAAIALANKMARIIRAMLVNGELYRRPRAA
jgi:transposase